MGSILDIANITRKTSGTSTSTRPVLSKSVNQRFRDAMPALLEVLRSRDGTTGALDGTIAVMGAKLPNPNMPSSTVMLSRVVLPGAGVAYTIDTNIDYAAFSAGNWLVVIGGVVMDYLASPSAATDFAVSDNSGKARITVGTTSNRPTDGARIEIYKVTPVTLLADGANEITTPVEIVGKSVYWVVGTHGSNLLSATRVVLRGLP